MKIKIQMICEEGRNTSFPKNATWVAKIIVLAYGTALELSTCCQLKVFYSLQKGKVRSITEHTL